MRTKTEARWWLEDDSAASVFAAVRRIQRQQGDRIQRLLEAQCIYDDDQALGLSLGGYTVRRAEIRGRTSLNMTAVCVDTIHAEIAQARPRPMFLTSGADYSLRRKAQRMGKFVEGVYSETGYHDLAAAVALDALVTGLGTLRVVETDGRVSIERVLPHEVWIDRRDGYYGAPRSVYITRWVDREVLKEHYPEHADALDVVRDELDYAWRWEDSENDQVCVVEAWHLASSPEADDGKHVICVSGTELESEPWTARTFPLAFLRWKKPMAGFHGKGLVDELRKLQRALNVLLADVEDGQELHTHTKIGIERGSKVQKGHFTADAGTFVEFDRQPPVPIVIPPVSPDTYGYIDKIISWFFQLSGTSQAASRSEKAAGVTSGRAIRLTADLQSKRFIVFARAFEQLAVDVAREVVRLMERLSESDKGYEVVCESKSHTETIAWNDVKLDEGSYVLQVWPTNLLPSTPQGKLESVMEMLNSGFADKLGIPGEQILKLLDFPDVEAAFGMVTASWDLVEQILEKMLDQGEDGYSPPEPFYKLDLCVLIAVRHYMQWRVWDVPEDRMELLRRWIGDCRDLIDKAAAPSAPPAPPPAPGAGPMPAPGAPPPVEAAA